MRSLLILACSLFLFACKTVTPPVVLTETVRGEVVVMAPIQETGDRDDVPVGVKPREIVGKVTTKTGAKVYLADKHPLNPFNKPDLYLNQQAIQEGVTVEQPKQPWWKWPLIVLSMLAAFLIVAFADKVRSIVRGLMWWKK